MPKSNYAPAFPRIFQPKDFANCKGIKSGPVFLIGSGQSAENFPIEEFSGVPAITMNGAISMFCDTDINPFFYVCTDRDFSNQQPKLFAEAMRRSEHVALWTDHLARLKTRPMGTAYGLRKAQKHSLLTTLLQQDDVLVRKRAYFSRRSTNIGFSKDLGQGFFDARTVMYLALQTAYHVGFTTVFLVGFDLDQSVGRFYENGTEQCSPCGLDQHYQSRILPSLKLMSKQVMNADFQVFNLSPHSRVPHDIIPKINLDDVRRMLTR